MEGVHQVCVLKGGYGVADRACFSSAHCFICILTDIINHVACIQCWIFSENALTEGEYTNLYVRVD